MTNQGEAARSGKPLSRVILDRAVRVFAGIVAVASGLASLAPTAFAQGASQIVLSCTTPAPESSSSNGCSSSELISTPPIISGNTLYFVAGFWVWCQNPNGGTPYCQDCSGSMYVGEVNLSTNKATYEATSVSGGSSAGGNTGLEVTFTSSDGDVTCTIDVPTAPTSGGTNQLGGTCNGIPIAFSHAVVHVTGS
jgi:hypothetical protein